MVLQYEVESFLKLSTISKFLNEFISILRKLILQFVFLNMSFAY